MRRIRRIAASLAMLPVVAASVFAQQPDRATFYLTLGKEKAAPSAPPPVATTTTTTVAPPTPPVPVRKSVTIRFEAEPAGAHVFRKKDDKDLGVVPVEIQLAKDAAKTGPDALGYVLPGYQERPLAADVTTDRTFHVSLEKAPAPVDSKHKAVSHKGPRKPRNPVDEDGLATQSF